LGCTKQEGGAGEGGKEKAIKKRPERVRETAYSPKGEKSTQIRESKGPEWVDV